MQGTVKQFKDMIEEMKSIYPFDEEKTCLSTNDILRMGNHALEIQTVDIETGITIVMSKRVPDIEF